MSLWYSYRWWMVLVTKDVLVRYRGCLLTVEDELFAAMTSRIRFLELIFGMQCRQRRSSQKEQSRASSSEGA